MSSSIHYKFRTENVYKTLAFNGNFITANELKREICKAEGIKTELFDLVLSDSFNNKKYVGDDQIPRNSSVTVIKGPKPEGKLPKIR